jgi:hypothetical protein
MIRPGQTGSEDPFATQAQSALSRLTMGSQPPCPRAHSHHVPRNGVLERLYVDWQTASDLQRSSDGPPRVRAEPAGRDGMILLTGGPVLLQHHYWPGWELRPTVLSS